VLAASKTPLDAALELSVDHEEIVTRLSGRRSCSNCQRTFHIVNERPAVEGVCDGCGGELVQREDDKAEVIKRRLEVYAEQTEPIISFYRNEGLLITISATGPVNQITDSAIAALSRVK
jgi:adenylate kinase